MADFPTTAGDFAPSIMGATLTADLDIGWTNHMEISDTAGAQVKGGVALVDSEPIYYGMFDPSDPGKLYDLQRGMNEVAEADHVIGASVTLFGYSSNAAQQAHILNLEARLQALEP